MAILLACSKVSEKSRIKEVSPQKKKMKLLWRIEKWAVQNVLSFFAELMRLRKKVWFHCLPKQKKAHTSLYAKEELTKIG